MTTDTTTSSIWGIDYDMVMTLDCRIPPHLKPMLRVYLETGKRPAYPFLGAVLANDIAAALEHGDPAERASLFSIVNWLRAHAPAEAWGSAVRVEKWMRRVSFRRLSEADRERAARTPPSVPVRWDLSGVWECVSARSEIMHGTSRYSRTLHVEGPREREQLAKLIIWLSAEPVFAINLDGAVEGVGMAQLMCAEPCSCDGLVRFSFLVDSTG